MPPLPLNNDCFSTQEISSSVIADNVMTWLRDYPGSGSVPLRGVFQLTSLKYEYGAHLVNHKEFPVVLRLSTSCMYNHSCIYCCVYYYCDIEYVIMFIAIISNTIIQ